MRRAHVRRNPVSFRFLVIMTVVILALGILVFSPKRTAASSVNDSERNKYFTCVYVDYGDTLWEIAGKYATPEYPDYYAYIDEVMQINHLANTNIKTGMKLCVPYYAEEPIC